MGDGDQHPEFQQLDVKTAIRDGLRSPHGPRLLPRTFSPTQLGVFQTKLTNGNTANLLQIRNPWGNQDSTLIWNDSDPRWSQVLPE